MRYLIRRELDFQQPINLKRLSPFMKIYAGLVSKWHETNYYQTQLHKRLEADYAARVKRDEKLKDALLVVIYQELNNNKSLKKRGEECDEIIVCVKSKFIHSLDRILTHTDFLPYVITKVPEEPDVRVAFPDMPILVKVQKKRLGEEVSVGVEED